MAGASGLRPASSAGDGVATGTAGKDRTSLSRGLDPSSKAGELALLLIRCYRSLFVLVGGRPADMRHWMHTPNRDLGGIPAQELRSVQGLTRVLEYLDAMRGRV